jgi:molybdate transport system substrate-binding protein
MTKIINVLATGAYKAALERICAASGFACQVAYDSAAAVGRRVEAGEAADVVISAAPVMQALGAKGFLRADSLQPAGENAVCVAYPAGAAVPEVATPAALAGTLRGVAKISLSDPAFGGGSSGFFMQAVEGLGMEDEIRPKLIFTKGGQGAAPVAAGDASLGIAQTSEIAMLSGVAAVRLLPDDPAGLVTYLAGVSAAACDDAMSLLAFMRGAESVAILAECGLA